MKKQKRTMLTLISTLIAASMLLGAMPVFAANTGFLVTDFSSNLDENIEVGTPYDKSGTTFVLTDDAKVYVSENCNEANVTATKSGLLSVYGKTAETTEARKARIYIRDEQFASRTDKFAMCKIRVYPEKLADGVYTEFHLYGHYLSGSKKLEAKVNTILVYNNKIEILDNNKDVYRTYNYSDYSSGKNSYELAWLLNTSNDQVNIYLDGILLVSSYGSYSSNNVASFKMINVICPPTFKNSELFLDDIYFVFGDSCPGIYSVSAADSVRVGDTLTATKALTTASTGAKTVWMTDGKVIAGGDSLKVQGRYVGKTISANSTAYDDAGMYGMAKTSTGTAVKYTGNVALTTGTDSNSNPTVTANIALSDFFTEEGNTDKSFVYLLAAYDGDVMVDCAVSGQITSADAAAGTTLTVTGVDSTEDVKLFVLNSMGTLVPVEKVFEW